MPAHQINSTRTSGSPLHPWINHAVRGNAERALCQYDRIVAELTDMKTWKDRLGRTQLRTVKDEDGHFWLEQNPDKRSTWAKFARQGHDVAWEFEGPGGAYTGRMLIDGAIYTPSEATKKFLRGPR
jgi:hypothetical protein